MVARKVERPGSTLADQNNCAWLVGIADKAAFINLATINDLDPTIFLATQAVSAAPGVLT